MKQQPIPTVSGQEAQLLPSITLVLIVAFLMFFVYSSSSGK